MGIKEYVFFGNRVYVGYVGQYDMKKDQQCFQIDTRPSQVERPFNIYSKHAYSKNYSFIEILIVTTTSLETAVDIKTFFFRSLIQHENVLTSRSEKYFSIIAGQGYN